MFIYTRGWPVACFEWFELLDVVDKMFDEMSQRKVAFFFGDDVHFFFVCIIRSGPVYEHIFLKHMNFKLVAVILRMQKKKYTETYCHRSYVSLSLCSFLIVNDGVWCVIGVRLYL